MLPGQRADHVFTRDAPIQLQRQTLPRVLIHDRHPLLEFERSRLGSELRKLKTDFEKKKAACQEILIESGG